MAPWFPQTVGYVQTASDAELFVHARLAEWLLQQTYAFAISSVKDDSLIGCATLKSFDWLVGRAEIAYYLDHASEGQGLMLEAMEAVLAFAFGELHVTKVEARVAEENLRSATLLERLGFGREGRIRRSFVANGRSLDMVHFGLVRELAPEK